MVLCPGTAVPLFKRVLDSFSPLESYSSFLLHVPMRDGQELETFFFTPHQNNPPWPCILVQSPYRLKWSYLEELLHLTEEGYAIVFQRTRPNSFGLLGLFTQPNRIIKDTFDTCTWLINSSFCNGSIGMWGLSASAIIQNFVGGQDIPGLKGLYTINSTCQCVKDAIFCGDILQKDVVQNTRIHPLIQTFLGMCSFRKSSPLFRMIEPKQVITSQQKPTIYCTGWYDFFSQGTIASFVEHQHTASSTSILIIGPWSHFPMKDTCSNMFPHENDLPFDCSPQKWFDHCLKGENLSEKISSLYYVIHPGGEGGWKKLEIWPVPSQDMIIPFKMESARSLIIQHDPSLPVPTVGGWNLALPSGAINQEDILEHPFVKKLVLDFQVEEETIVTGFPQLHLSFLKTEQTAFITKLCHISQKGEWIPLSQGAKNLEEMTSDYVISCSPISFLLKPEEKLGLLFSSSSDPALQHVHFPTSITLDLDKSQIVLPIEKDLSLKAFIKPDSLLKSFLERANSNSER